MKIITSRDFSVPIKQAPIVGPLSPPPVQMFHNSLIVTQVDVEGSNFGSLNSNGFAFSSVHIPGCKIVMSLYPIDQSGQVDMSLLNFISMSAGIVEIPPNYQSQGDFSRQSNSSDSLNLGNLLSATKGRLSFDLSQYPVSMLSLIYTNHSRRMFTLRIEEFYYQN